MPITREMMRLSLSLTCGREGVDLTWDGGESSGDIAGPPPTSIEWD